MISLSKNVQLQNITIEDHNRLVKLLWEIYPPAYKDYWQNEDCSFYINTFFSLENLKVELEEKDADYFFVIYNNEPVGIFRIQYNKHLEDFPDKSSSYIHRIYLSEKAQGKGIAKLIFNWAEAKCQQKGNDFVWLKAMTNKSQAVKFYKKQGYRFCKDATLDFESLKDELRSMYILYKPLTTS